MAIHALKPSPDAEIVEALEEALTRARSGETVAIFLLEVSAESQVKTGTRIGRRDQLVYALEYAKAGWIREAIDGSR